ncbi:UNVERIFIED_CONTAM: hypothetical protein HDU68_012012 [Siphonaria sp. JEL0065]|nr:hypothetical protein HDU68_012012 [Siphonaria sp. JEL0065]
MTETEEQPVNNQPALLISDAAGGSALEQLGQQDDKTGPAVVLSSREFTMVLLGLAMAVLMASLDATIVSTALKAVVAEFGRQDLIPWVGSSYLLTSAPFGIMYGKLADLFGRKGVFVFAMIVFELGSLVCAAAPNMSILILGRAVAGIGGGGIFTIAFIIISDIAAIKDRAKYQGIVGGVYGLATIIGPLVGGYFADHVTWRWCFYINLPIGAVAVPAVIWSLRLPSPEGSFLEKFKRVDMPGVFLVFAIIAAVITPTQFGGSVWAWSSPQVICLYILTALLIAAFVYVERFIAKEPIVPPSLFSQNTSIPAIMIAGLAVGAAFVGAIYYISLFFQIVNGDSATVGGVKAVPLIFGHVTLSIVTGVVIVFDCRNFPHATGLAQTSVPLGGAFGIAISGALFNNIIASDIDNYPILTNAIAQLQANGIEIQPTEVLPLSQLLTTLDFVTNGVQANADLIHVFNGAFKIAYLSLLAYPLIILFVAFLIKEYRVGEGDTKREISMAV